jgi:hypothetical protein
MFFHFLKKVLKKVKVNNKCFKDESLTNERKIEIKMKRVDELVLR